jgi:hypothetical protein
MLIDSRQKTGCFFKNPACGRYVGEWGESLGSEIRSFRGFRGKE